MDSIIRIIAVWSCLTSGVRALDSWPNIVVFLADDLGYGELSCQGNPQIPTPHIDSIARRGVRFTSGYVTASYCSASRAGLLTGRYQSRFGYDDNPTGATNELPGVGLPTGEKTLATILQDHGYATALIGKWHLGGTAPFHPLRRGFDEFFGFTHEGHYFLPPPYTGATTMLRRKTLPPGSSNGRWVSDDGKLVLSSHLGHNEPDYDANNPLLRQSQPVNEAEYLTDAITREAVSFIDRHPLRPFFLYVAYNAVHSPLQGTDRYMDRFRTIDDIHRRIFAAMLSNLDDSVGAILAKLQQEELLENTLVFFLSDNGGPTKELTSSNRPLRGGKGLLYEGGVRVPFLMQWPARIQGNKTFAQPVISLDIAATALAAAAHTPASKLDGVDLLPWLGDRERPESRELFWRMDWRAAIRSGPWKAVRHSRTSQDAWELYNLNNDLGESQDLSSSHEDLKQQLVRRWNEINRQMHPPIRWR